VKVLEAIYVGMCVVLGEVRSLFSVTLTMIFVARS
jgi:hypothetical protein